MSVAYCVSIIFFPLIFSLLCAIRTPVKLYIFVNYFWAQVNVNNWGFYTCYNAVDDVVSCAIVAQVAAISARKHAAIVGFQTCWKIFMRKNCCSQWQRLVESRDVVLVLSYVWCNHSFVDFVILLLHLHIITVSLGKLEGSDGDAEMLLELWRN